MKELIRNLESKNKLMQVYLDNLQTATEIIDRIIPSIWKFDNKVFNRRLENAVEAVINEGRENRDRISIKIELEYSRMKIELSFYNHRSITENSCCYYIPSGYESISICYLHSDFNIYWMQNEGNKKYYHKDNGSYFYIDENYNTRIQSTAIVDGLLDRQKELKEKISQLKEETAKTLDYAQRLEGLKAEIEKLNDIIPSEIKSFYELKTWANWY